MLDKVNVGIEERQANGPWHMSHEAIVSHLGPKSRSGATVLLFMYPHGKAAAGLAPKKKKTCLLMHLLDLIIFISQCRGHSQVRS